MNGKKFNATFLFVCIAELSKVHSSWEMLNQHAKGLAKLSDDKWLLNACIYLVSSKTDAKELEGHKQLLSIIFSVRDSFRYLPDVQSEQSFMVFKYALNAHLCAITSNELTVKFIETAFKKQNALFHDKLSTFLCDNVMLIRPDVIFLLHQNPDFSDFSVLLSENQMVAALDVAEIDRECNAQGGIHEQTSVPDLTL